MSHPTYVMSLSPQAKWYVLIRWKYLIPLTCLNRGEPFWSAWEGRLSKTTLFCCCWLRSGKNYRDNVPQISQIFSRLFGERDYVPSDLLAGLILAKARQKHEIEAKKLLGAQIQCGVDINGRHVYDLSQYGKLSFENGLKFNIKF